MRQHLTTPVSQGGNRSAKGKISRSAPAHAGNQAMQTRLAGTPSSKAIQLENAAATASIGFSDNPQTAVTLPKPTADRIPSGGSLLAQQGSAYPLPTALRNRFESHFHTDFSSVRIHTDERAHAFAADLNARAVTSGEDIVFAARKFAPHTPAGQRLLAHELTHVMQQRRDPQAPRLQCNGGLDEDSDYDPESERLRQCRSMSNWTDGGHWIGLGPEPNCSDALRPGRLECQNGSNWSEMGEWRGIGPEPDCSNAGTPNIALAQALRRAGEEYWARWQRNRDRIYEMRDTAGSDAEALAQIFESTAIEDSATAPGRLGTVLNQTRHWLIPGLQTGIAFGDTGFRSEFQDSAIWPSSGNQVGHFLTAVRLGYDPSFLDNWQQRYILDTDEDVNTMALRLIVGHEQAPDPGMLGTFASLIPLPGRWGFEEQYHNASDADIENFRTGNLAAVHVGSGRGNSMQDLALSYKGWVLGRLIAEGKLTTSAEVAAWIRREIGTP